MSSAVKISVQKDDEDKHGIVELMVKVATAERTRRQAVGDALVTLVAFPTLITCTILLASCMHTDWVRDKRTRVHVLVLGATLLAVSLFVCIYTIQRLGICAWPSKEKRAMPEHRIRRRTISGCLPPPLACNDSELDLLHHLPPCYSSLVRCSERPPPYTTHQLTNEKPERARSFLSPVHAATRPPGTG